MPTMPPTLHKRGEHERRRDYDRERRKVKPWRKLYATARWRIIRARQLQAQPLCERHLKQDMIVAADTVNHKTPHRGNEEMFFAGPFESLCKACHDGVVQREERQPST